MHKPKAVQVEKSISIFLSAIAERKIELISVLLNMWNRETARNKNITFPSFLNMQLVGCQTKLEAFTAHLIKNLHLKY